MHQQPTLTVIDSNEGIERLREYLADKDLIAYDCETTGLIKGSEIVGYSVCASEEEAFYVITHAWDPIARTLNRVTAVEPTLALITSLTGKRLIMHNGLFDCAMSEWNWKIRLISSLHTDTMVLAHLLDENRYIGLKELSKQYFGESATAEQVEMKASVLANGGVWQDKKGGDKEMFKADPAILGKYGAKDAWLTYRLFFELVPELIEEGLDKFFYDEESMPLLRTTTYDLNTIGLKVDVPALTSLGKQLEAECAEAKAFILQEIAPYIRERYPGTSKKNTFNIGSSSQLAWLAFGQLNLEFGTLTKEGKKVCKALGLKLPYVRGTKRQFIEACSAAKGQEYAPPGIKNGKKIKAKKIKDVWAYLSTDKKVMQRLAPKYRWIEKLLEYQAKDKMLGTYVEGIMARTRYGIIQPSFVQTGTKTGRYSSKNPNFQNLPRKDKRIKGCIVARPGKVFVGADYSQLEPRCFAYYSQDERLMAAFSGTDDFYSVLGMEIFEKYDCTASKESLPDSFRVKYEKLRDDTKVIALAPPYGATAFQLASSTGKSIDETQEIIDAYFEKFPGIKKMMLDGHAFVKKHGYVQNLFGRKRRISEAKLITKLYGDSEHGGLPYEARKMLNMAVNQPIQGTAGSIVNRASIRFYALCAQADILAPIVLQVHDSLVAECDEKDAENVSLLLSEAMENTVLLEGVPLEAIPKIGANLGEV